jgi:ABC-2 type transport system permease protein
MAPRIIAAILLTQILVFGVNAFVVEKESGTIKQLHLSTLNIKEYLISKALPIFIIGTVMFTFMIISSVFVFKMPIRGNILAVFLSTFLYFLALLSLSFCTVIFTNTSLQAYLALSFIFQIPFILFSGFFFPIHNMPDIFQLISLLNPLRHYLEIIVGLTLKGATIFDLQAQFIMLGLLSFSFLSFGFLFFKKIFE